MYVFIIFHMAKESSGNQDPLENHTWKLSLSGHSASLPSAHFPPTDVVNVTFLIYNDFLWLGASYIGYLVMCWSMVVSDSEILLESHVVISHYNLQNLPRLVITKFILIITC